MIPKKLGPHVRYDDPRILPFLLKSRETDEAMRALLFGKARWTYTDAVCGLEYWCSIHGLDFDLDDGVATLSLEASEVDPEVAAETARIVAEQGLNDLPAIFLSLRRLDGGLVGDVWIYQGDVIGESRRGKSAIHGLHRNAYVIGRRDVVLAFRHPDVEGRPNYSSSGCRPLPPCRHIQVDVTLANAKRWAREVNDCIAHSNGWKCQEEKRKSAVWAARQARKARREMEQDWGLVTFQPPEPAVNRHPESKDGAIDS